MTNLQVVKKKKTFGINEPPSHKELLKLLSKHSYKTGFLYYCYLN